LGKCGAAVRYGGGALRSRGKSQNHREIKTPAAEEGGRVHTSLYRLVLAAIGGERLRLSR